MLLMLIYYRLDTSHLPALITIISTLLRDRSPLSIGTAAAAFEAVCPTRLDLLHQQYRRLCKILVDVDEWGQVDLLNLLLRYARTMLSRPVVKLDGNEEVDGDVKLLLASVEPLLQSRNPAVGFPSSRIINTSFLLIFRSYLLSLAYSTMRVRLPSFQRFHNPFYDYSALQRKWSVSCWCISALFPEPYL